MGLRKLEKLHSLTEDIETNLSKSEYHYEKNLWLLPPCQLKLTREPSRAKEFAGVEDIIGVERFFHGYHDIHRRAHLLP